MGVSAACMTLFEEETACFRGLNPAQYKPWLLARGLLKKWEKHWALGEKISRASI
jgi:hypothetical protein